jgi:negative regulator of flagellin synthesis FlgM
MNIHGNKPPENRDINLAVGRTGKTEAGEKAAVGQAKTPQADTVDISNHGKEVAGLMSAINQLPGVREDKIKSIQESLAAGTYSIDPQKIADKILKEI